MTRLSYSALAAIVLAAVPAPFLMRATAQESGPTAGQPVILVTGATSGLGREVALRLAAGGAHVIVHGRSEARGVEVVDEIRRAGKGGARFYGADLASNAEIRRFAEAILRDYARLDVLVNNAGVAMTPPDRSPTADGVEYRMQVNYLSGVLLTRLLLPRLQASAPARGRGEPAELDMSPASVVRDQTPVLLTYDMWQSGDRPPGRTGVRFEATCGKRDPAAPSYRKVTGSSGLGGGGHD